MGKEENTLEWRRKESNGKEGGILRGIKDRKEVGELSPKCVHIILLPMLLYEQSPQWVNGNFMRNLNSGNKKKYM